MTLLDVLLFWKQRDQGAARFIYEPGTARIIFHYIAAGAGM